jgi:hypothetical protein
LIPVIINMKFTKRFLSISVSLLFASLGLQAQVWEVGAKVGGAAYMGDLNLNNPFKISGLAAGVFVKANFDPYWGLGMHYMHGSISGDDADSKLTDFRNRNINFKTPLNEISFQLDFNFLDYFTGGGRKNFSPYVFGGAGGVVFKPTATYDQYYKTYKWQSEGQTQRYKTYTLTAIYGAGLKYRIKNTSFSLLGELGFRTPLTDYLDDVSGTYATQYVTSQEHQVLTEYEYAHNVIADPSVNKIGVAGSQRGDGRARDSYMFATVGLSFSFTEDCFNFLKH